MDILDDLGVPNTNTVLAPAQDNAKKEKVNMYEVEVIKELEIDTDKLQKEGHTFAVHVFDGGEDVDVVGEQMAKIAIKLKDKGFVDSRKFGNMYQFFPLVSHEAYQTKDVGDVLNKYFDNSYKNMVTYFAKKEKISESELEEILKMIKKK